MHNIKLTIAYDGTDYAGWQIQTGQPTIQGTLTGVLSQITQEHLTIHGAGRTDAGVHAWGQVASFRTGSPIAPRELAHALNALLPPSIRILQAQEVGPDFHARWLARAKTYHYRVYCGEIVPPFLWRYVLHVRGGLDFAAMAEAARCFKGERDFSTFAASSGSPEDDRQRSPIRRIFRSEFLPACAVHRHGFANPMPADDSDERENVQHEWVFVIRGESFLRHMVRKMTGTLLEIGRGRLTPADVPRLLGLRDRACSGPNLPAQGLCLMSVEYPDPADSLRDRQ